MVLARDLDVAGIALSQLNRSLEYRADKRPMLADLGESGAPEPRPPRPPEGSPGAGRATGTPAARTGHRRRPFICSDDIDHADSNEKGVAEVIVAKHRNGPTAKIRLAFLEHLTRFADLTR